MDTAGVGVDGSPGVVGRRAERDGAALRRRPRTRRDACCAALSPTGTRRNALALRRRPRTRRDALRCAVARGLGGTPALAAVATDSAGRRPGRRRGRARDRPVDPRGRRSPPRSEPTARWPPRPDRWTAGSPGSCAGVSRVRGSARAAVARPRLRCRRWPGGNGRPVVDATFGASTARGPALRRSSGTRLRRLGARLAVVQRRGRRRRPPRSASWRSPAWRPVCRGRSPGS